MSETLDQIRARAERHMEENSFQLRSCWNCNGAHEHLKHPDAGVVCCFDCGHWYFEGHDLTIDETARPEEASDELDTSKPPPVTP